MSAGVENTSRNVSTAARGSGERRLSRTPAPVSAAPLRAIVMPAATDLRCQLDLRAARGLAVRRTREARTRSRTSSWNTGSLVYWAMPMPRVNGR